MNLFIDTNVFLSFFHYSSEDLEELKKLTVLIETQKATLWLPEQVRNEFARNRANKIADALKNLRAAKPDPQFPQIVKGYPEFAEARKALAEADRRVSALRARLDADIAAVTLAADQTIATLFAKATSIPTSDALVARARQRVDLGNPPGKNQSHGDAVNWEALLDQVPKGENLFFITDDGDYTSALDGELFDPFLLDEWSVRKGGSNLTFYRRLSQFFKVRFPQINLASELEKDLLTRELQTAASFASAKSVLRRIRQYTEISDTEANAIADAAGTNNQVYWIINDADVRPYFERLITDHGAKMDPLVLTCLRYRLGEVKSSEYFATIFGGDDDEEVQLLPPVT
jgi:predicted nucleic acid-binding protein